MKKYTFTLKIDTEANSEAEAWEDICEKHYNLAHLDDAIVNVEEHGDDELHGCVETDHLSVPKEDLLLMVDGKFFRCECGCNVFNRPFPDINHYAFECNGCKDWYEGEPRGAI